VSGATGAGDGSPVAGPAAKEPDMNSARTAFRQASALAVLLAAAGYR
jgi:hypothetical protein